MGRVHDRQGSQAGLAMKRERVAKGKPAEVDLVLAVQLWRRGESMETIGEALGVSAKRAARVLRAAGHFIPYGKRKTPRVEKRSESHEAGERGPIRSRSIDVEGWIVLMHDEQCMSFTEIGAALDVSRQRAHQLYWRAKVITTARPKDEEE